VSRCTVDRSTTSGSAETFAAVNCVKAGVSSVDILPFFVVVIRVGLSPSSLSTVTGRSSSVFGTSSRRLPSAVWVEVACSWTPYIPPCYIPCFRGPWLVRRRAVSSLVVDRRRQPSRCRETAVRLPTNILVSCFRTRPTSWTVVPGTSSLSGAVVSGQSPSFVSWTVVQS